MPKIIIDIPNDKAADFMAGYLKAAPIPLDADGNPTMPARRWVSESLTQYARHVYEQGKRELAVESATPTIDKDILTGRDEA